MASTRKTSRTKSINAASPSAAPSPNKRRKSGSPVVFPTESLSQKGESVAPEDVVPTSVQGSLDVEEVEVTEELVVTVDVTASAEEEPGGEAVDSLTLVQTTTAAPGGELVSEDSSVPEKTGVLHIFKDNNFIHSSKGSGGNKKTRVWKNLKQIIAAERSLPWGPNVVTYGSIDAPPSFKPAKKYSDISGLEARYTDPQTKMRFSNADEYRRVRILPGDIITGCLTLRKANTMVP